MKLLPPVTSLLDSADQALLKEFPDLEVVMNNKMQCLRFSELPLVALRALLLNDVVKVGAEETEFILIHLWWLNESKNLDEAARSRVALLGALQRKRSQGSAQRPQDPLETENTQKREYNHVTTTNKCRNANSQIVH